MSRAHAWIRKPSRLTWASLSVALHLLIVLILPHLVPALFIAPGPPAHQIELVGAAATSPPSVQPFAGAAAAKRVESLRVTASREDRGPFAGTGRPPRGRTTTHRTAPVASTTAAEPEVAEPSPFVERLAGGADPAPAGDERPKLESHGQAGHGKGESLTRIEKDGAPPLSGSAAAAAVAPAAGKSSGEGNGPGFVWLNETDRRYAGYFREIYRKVDRLWGFPKALEVVFEQGDVLVQFVIDADGSVHNLRVRKSSGFEQFDENVVAAIRKAAPFGPIPPGLGRRLHILAPFEFSNPMVR